MAVEENEIASRFSFNFSCIVNRPLLPDARKETNNHQFYKTMSKTCLKTWHKFLMSNYLAPPLGLSHN